MSYKNKVSGVCKQDEDLLGEKFRYNREDDIVLLFNEEKPDTAYCYKRTDLSRLVKDGYKSDNSRFRYIVAPHTNQYIVNPEEITEGTWHGFILKKVRDREKYRRDYPETLYFVEKGTGIDFEDPPEVGDEVPEEKVEIVPSEAYLERERKMREIRERREERAISDDESEEDSISHITNDPQSIQRFNNLKDLFDRMKARYTENIRRWLTPGVLERILYRDEEGKTPPITRTESLSNNPPFEDPNLVWINQSFNLEGSKVITWYRGREKHRENNPAQIIFSGDDNNPRNFILYWYRNGELDNDVEPCKVDSTGIITWKSPPPTQMNFNDNIITFYTSEYFITTLYRFEDGIFGGIETRGFVTYYREDGSVRETEFIPL